MKKLAFPIGVLIIAIIAGVILFIIPGKSHAPTTTEPNATTTPAATGPWHYKDVLTVDSFNANAVGTPLTLSGTARGWYFEASFPVSLLDESGKTIASGPATATSDWMTSEPVSFTITLTFPQQPSGSKGTLTLHKDNPSGLPQNEDSYSIPVVFK